VIAWSIISTVLLVFLILLFLRLIFEYVFLLARGFRPQGPLVFLLETIYSVTDPPLKALRRVLPPLRIGQVSLDLAFLVVFSGTWILWNVARANS
jgi:YggT family protein